MKILLLFPLKFSYKHTGYTDEWGAFWWKDMHVKEECSMKHTEENLLCHFNYSLYSHDIPKKKKKLAVLLTMKIYSDWLYWVYSHNAPVDRRSKSDYIECSQNNNIVRWTASKNSRFFLLSTHAVILTSDSTRQLYSQTYYRVYCITYWDSVVHLTPWDINHIDVVLLTDAAKYCQHLMCRELQEGATEVVTALRPNSIVKIIKSINHI